MVSLLRYLNSKVFGDAKKSHIGIDLWHAVEFSRYGCALLPKISLRFQGRPTNLVQPGSTVKLWLRDFFYI